MTSTTDITRNGTDLPFSEVPCDSSVTIYFAAAPASNTEADPEYIGHKSGLTICFNRIHTLLFLDNFFVAISPQSLRVFKRIIVKKFHVDNNCDELGMCA